MVGSVHATEAEDEQQDRDRNVRQRVGGERSETLLPNTLNEREAPDQPEHAADRGQDRR